MPAGTASGTARVPRRPQRPSSKTSKGSAGSARTRQPSLRETYLKACAEAGIHPNSGIVQLLPDKQGVVFPSDTLNISSNYLGDKGIVPVLAVVERMLQMHTMVVRENGIRNKGVQAICSVASKHPSMQSIDLSDNYISEGAAASLEKLLQDNHNITEVVLDNTKIDVEWRVRLKDLVISNQEGLRAAAAAIGAESMADHV